MFHFFFFNDTATTEIYTLSLHDALPIWYFGLPPDLSRTSRWAGSVRRFTRSQSASGMTRSCSSVCVIHSDRGRMTRRRLPVSGSFRHSLWFQMIRPAYRGFRVITRTPLPIHPAAPPLVRSQLDPAEGTPR